LPARKSILFSDLHEVVSRKIFIAKGLRLKYCKQMA
jgi:hypothetical protein